MQTVGYKSDLTGQLFEHPVLDPDTQKLFSNQHEIVLRSEAEKELEEVKQRVAYLDDMLTESTSAHIEALDKIDTLTILLTQTAEVIGEEAFAVNMDGIIIGPDFHSIPDAVRKLTTRRSIWGVFSRYLSR